MNKQKTALFLDRDGILNTTEVRDGKPYAPRRYTDFQIIPAAIALVTSFKQAGYYIVVVTNQPDVGNGFTAKTEVEQMHAQLMSAMPLDLIKVCYHSQKKGCACRKPKPGMLQAAAAELDLDLANSIMVGDRGSDIAAGRAVGCFTIFLQCGYNEQILVKPDLVVNELSEITPQLTLKGDVNAKFK